MSEPLKPCPFCGAPGQVDGYHGRYDVLSYCGACRACDYSLEGDNSPEEAAARWNRRAVPAQPSQESVCSDGNADAGRLADEILSAGPWGLPAEGSPEEAAMVERMLKAYDDEFNQTNMAYRRPMRAALRALRTGGGK